MPGRTNAGRARSQVAVAGTTSMARIARRSYWRRCALGGNAAARDLQDVLNTGTLRVGVTLFAPWAARGADGELVGFEVDVARQLAADMGVEAQLLRLRRRPPRAGARVRRDRHHRRGPDDHAGARAARELQRAVRRERHRPRDARRAHGERHGRRRRSTARRSRSRPSKARSARELARRLWPRARVQVFTSVEAASEALLAGEVHGYVEDEPVPTFLALENPGVIDVPTGRPLLASPRGIRGQQRRPRLSRVLECLDHGARGRHVAADDGELLVRVAALARAARQCAPLERRFGASARRARRRRRVAARGAERRCRRARRASSTRRRRARRRPRPPSSPRICASRCRRSAARSGRRTRRGSRRCPRNATTSPRRSS